MPSLEEYVEEIKDMWDTHWLTNMGPKHKKFQEELKQYLGVENIDLMTNGHMALELSLQALNLSGEVITTPFTFASTTHAIVRNGLEPVFCDIDPVDFTMDVTKLESLITDRTCAIMPVHVYGNVCNIEEIDRIAKKYGLKSFMMQPILLVKHTKVWGLALMGMFLVLVSMRQKYLIPLKVGLYVLVMN